MDDQPADTSTLQKVKNLLGEEGFAQTFAPIEEASGLPNAAYWSDEWLKLEQEHCFRRSWVFAGAAAGTARTRRHETDRDRWRAFDRPA